MKRAVIMAHGWYMGVQLLTTKDIAHSSAMYKMINANHETIQKLLEKLYAFDRL